MIQKDLKTLIESVTPQKAYPVRIPQSVELPAILYRSVSQVRSGDSNMGKSNVRRYRYQLNIVGETQADTFTIGDTITEALENYSGVVGTTNIMSCHITNDIDTYNSTQQTYEKVLDLELTINRGIG